MNQIKKQKIIVVTGPTASGKTKLAIQIALYIKKNFKKYNGSEIISIDSRQIYKDIPIGSNSPSKKEKKLVPHHLVEIKKIKQKVSVAQFQKLALRAIKKLWEENKIPIICGGNWFYIQSIIDGITFPPVPPNKKLRKKLEQKNISELLNILKELDKKRWEKIDKKNKRRIIRAIEIASTLGKVPPPQKNPLPAKIIIFGINIPKEKLKEKIEKRSKLMIKKGLIEETKKLIQTKIPLKYIEELGFEYKNVLKYLKGEIKNKKILADAITKDTINYVKKQLTWLKKEKRIIWINNKEEALKIIKKDFY